MLKKTLAFICLTLSINVSATIIDKGAYTTDTNTGLDWLDVTESQGRSYADMATQFGSDGDFEGWQFATTAQFTTLLINATALATTEIINPYGYVLSNSHVTHDIIVMLGNTCVGSTCTNPYDIRYTFGWVELPTNGHQGTGKGETAIIFDYHDYINGWGEDSRTLYGYGSDYPGDGRHNPVTVESPNLGSFLVRTSVVPIPGTVWFFGSSLLALAGVARRKNA